MFTPEEKAILKKYVTDPDGDVFCVQNLEGIVGAVYARYSRARGGFREVMLKEFIKEGLLDVEKASQLIERVLVAYGDDSVGELEGTHLSVENISVLATKEIEDRRIGGSPIEQSTRYVFYDQRDDQGQFRYYREPRIMASNHSKDYVETMDYIFQTYCDLIEPMKAYYQGLKSIDEAEYDVLGTGTKQKLADLNEEKDRKAFTVTYNSDIRTKACDSLRSILPIATKTNVGLFGNGRFFQWMLSHLYTSPLSEAAGVAQQAKNELDKVIPHYVKRAKKNDYRIKIREEMEKLTTELLSTVEPKEEDNITLFDHGEAVMAEEINTLVMQQSLVTADQLRELIKNEEDHLTYAMMLYEYCRHPLKQLLKIVRKLPLETKEKIRSTYIGERQTRRDRPYRALESGYRYTFDLVTDFGTYKDLMRHRMTSQLRQRFNPLLGFIVVEDIKRAGFEEKVLECHRRSAELYGQVVKDFPLEASYVTLHGHKVRWVMGFNEREAYHLLELRTTPQGHPQYRRVCQLMHKQIEANRAWRARAMKFVDHNDYFWSRADAEAKQRVGEKKLEENNK
ncbi:MAG: FAD-dependent thymidylate synthase [Candidatus Komeilibacteria bacterium]